MATANVVLKAVNANNVPSMEPTVRKMLGNDTDPYLVFSTKNGEYKTQVVKDHTEPVWNETFQLGELGLKDKVRISLYDKDRFKDDFIGYTEITVEELVSRFQMPLILQDKEDNPVVKEKCYIPTIVNIELGDFVIPETWPKPKERVYPQCSKHVMIISRGTRGDVQPYISLARGLAEQLGWMVTICTELSYKDFIKQNSKVEKGYIRFRPTGGDTAKRIETPVAKWAMTNRSELMQAAMLAHSEAEFFASEPFIFHWAETLKPDAVIFGFTMASIAMIISESLQIPIMGFILQPTCIPSKQYSAIVPILTHTLSVLDNLEETFVKHGFQSVMKKIMENNPFETSLSSLRKRRCLSPFRGVESKTWVELVKQNVPLIVPINEICFGGKPDDWNENSILTDFIFLRRGGVPDLAPHIKEFIANAKAAKEPLVVMAFSSMPVARHLILKVAIKMIKVCETKPRVIALVGPRDLSKEKKDSKVENQALELIEQGKLLEEKGAPFGSLFPHLDCIIVHGGLGTTAEALRVGVPVMVTGILLMDQRFWGKRVADLGVGPDPCHIKHFLHHCTEYMDKALKPGSEWAAKAKELAKQIQGKSDDGVIENVEAIKDRVDKTKYVNFT